VQLRPQSAPRSSYKKRAGGDTKQEKRSEEIDQPHGDTIHQTKIGPAVARYADDKNERSEDAYPFDRVEGVSEAFRNKRVRSLRR
jgi:hypothetical protein